MSANSSDRRIHLIVGLFVLAGIAAVLYLALKVGGPAGKAGGYSLRARFTDVGGLNPGSPVMISGVKVGTVGEISLNYDDFSAEIELNLPDGVQLEDDTIASIRSRGLLGENHVTLQPGGSGIPLKPGDIIIDTEPAISIGDIIGKIAFGGIDDSGPEPESEEDEDGGFGF